MIGIYADSFFFKRDTFERLHRDLRLHTPIFKQDLNTDDKRHTNKVSPGPDTQNSKAKIVQLWPHYAIQKSYGKQEMLRDLFLWSVYVGHAETAFVLLLHIKSRIGAALLATNMAQRLSLTANSMDKRQKYDEQAKIYEEYASKCIQDCHSYNEMVACQLLLREIPLFGNVTCMQVRFKSILRHYFSNRSAK